MIDLRLGKCLDVMRTMPDRSVHACVTSPPYFGLRDYGAEGQIGLEKTPEEFVAKMVAVFREVRRVLRDDGTLWLNLGDSFNSSPSNQQNGQLGGPAIEQAYRSQGRRKREVPGLKTKDLIGIPWRVAFALQADGWYLRSDIIWHKPNPMPESVRDRPTKSHEYMFLLSKSATYHYDADAVREPLSEWSEQALKGRWERKVDAKADETRKDSFRREGANYSQGINPLGRNRRSVWSVATRPFKGAHFATFPPKLIEPCILAGTSEAGCCPACGKPWERVVEKGELVPTRKHHDKRPCGVVRENADKNDQGSNRARDGHRSNMAYERQTLGFRPACSCDAGDAIPCTVLDPFNGAGTTGVVAKQHGRRYIGIELNPEYLALSRDRLESAHAVA